MDAELEEAMREVDAMLPGTPPIAPPVEATPKRGAFLELPIGWRFDHFTDEFVDTVSGLRHDARTLHLYRGGVQGFLALQRHLCRGRTTR